VLYGRAEQWVGEEYRILSAGEIAHIPVGTVHGTYNPHAEPLVFLAILSPPSCRPSARGTGSCRCRTAEPWAGLRARRGLAPCQWGEGQTG
jgi:hypothetical protein